MKYIEFFKKYKFPSLIEDIRNFDLPDYLGEPTFEIDYPLPPILLPLITVRSWPGYRGILFDPFGDLNSLIFAEYFVENHEMIEIAKNQKQFLIWLLFDLYSNTEKIQLCNNMSKSFDIFKTNDVEIEFNSIYSEEDLSRLDSFKKNPPAILNIKNGSPVWFSPEVSLNQINKFIDRGELRNAWYGINSKIFNHAEILDVLYKISEKLEKNNEIFVDLIECWKVATKNMQNV